MSRRIIARDSDHNAVEIAVRRYVSNHAVQMRIRKQWEFGSWRVVNLDHGAACALARAIMREVLKAKDREISRWEKRV